MILHRVEHDSIVTILYILHGNRDIETFLRTTLETDRGRVSSSEQISLILMIQAGSRGHGHPLDYVCAHLRKMSLFWLMIMPLLESYLSPCEPRALTPSPVAQKRLLRPRAKKVFPARATLFCACGERIPAVAGLCSPCYRLPAGIHADYFGGNRRRCSPAIDTGVRAAGQGTRSSMFTIASRA